MKINTKEIALVSLFSALMIIGAFIKIQFALPFTLQFLFCVMAGVLLGAKLGALSQIIYLLIGLIGFPVFTGGGGFSYVLKPSFGYLIGFIASAFIIGLIIERFKAVSFMKVLGASMVGVLVLYVFGVPYFLLINNLYLGSSVDILSSAIGKFGFIYYMGIDMVKIIIVALVAPHITRALKASGFLVKNSK